MFISFVTNYLQNYTALNLAACACCECIVSVKTGVNATIKARARNNQLFFVFELFFMFISFVNIYLLLSEFHKMNP
jgi:hypothetical protein